MKKIFISSFLVLAATLTGCQDAVDITQKGTLTEEVAFQTVDDVVAGVNLVYSQLTTKNQIALSSVWTDELAVGVENGGQGLSGQHTYIMNPGSALSENLYANNYYLISRANYLLEAASRIVPTTTADQDKLNKVIAECRFLRAFAHFELLTYYSVDLKDPNSLGVPVIDYIVNVTDRPIRGSVAEGLALVNSDLDFAYQFLPAAGNVNYLSKDAVTALQARIALYTGDLPTAISKADTLIQAYPLANPATYVNLWKDVYSGGQDGAIFVLKRLAANAAIADLWRNLGSYISGAPWYEIGRALFNKLDDNDVRKGVIVNLAPYNASDPSASGSLIDPDYQNSINYRADDILLLYKYPGSNQGERHNDLKVFRVEEMYLIKAEALISTDLNQAAAVIQDLVNSRFTANAPTISYTSAQAAYAGVLEQRRIELALEGFRWVDLKRLGVLAGQGLDRDPKDLELANNPVTPAVTSHMFTLPIPSRELAINPNLVQNPGY